MTSRVSSFNFHSQADSCLLTGLIPLSTRASIYLYSQNSRLRVSPELIGSQNCVPMTSTAKSPRHKTSSNGRSLSGMGLTRERAVLCWGLVKQARHEYMPDEYKDQYVIDVPPSPPLMKVRENTTVIPSELNKRGKVKRTNIGLPNTNHTTNLRKQS